MTAAEFQQHVLDDLLELRVAFTRFEERQDQHAVRLAKLERKQDDAQRDATVTDRHELLTVRKELDSRRRELWGWAGKAALLLLGSVLATLAPACSHLVGF